MSQEPLGPVGNSMFDNYRKLIEETLPAYKKQIAELETRVAELEKENARLQPKDVKQGAKGK
jgi:cell division protein FtsB